MELRTITNDELEAILINHKLWLRDDQKGARADLSGASLARADLFEAELSGANLYGANLYGADLRGAFLRRAYLAGANLSRANLCGANLTWVSFIGADLSGADLRGASLAGADLFEAELSGADLRGAYIYGTNLSGAYNINLPIVCPEEGSFIGFKKVCEDYIVKLEILSDALRSSATGRKCRCSKAKVISITNIDGSVADVTEAAAIFNHDFIYRVGEIVTVDNFDTDRWNECAPGIHFFMTRQEAVDYTL